MLASKRAHGRKCMCWAKCMKPAPEWPLVQAARRSLRSGRRGGRPQTRAQWWTRCGACAAATTPVTAAPAKRCVVALACNHTLCREPASGGGTCGAAITQAAVARLCMRCSHMI